MMVKLSGSPKALSTKARTALLPGLPTVGGVVRARSIPGSSCRSATSEGAPKDFGAARGPSRDSATSLGSGSEDGTHLEPPSLVTMTLGGLVALLTSASQLETAGQLTPETRPVPAGRVGLDHLTHRWS